MKQLDLEKDKIGKLLMTFSVPCIISLLVNALYNMVDQIFIGWGVGWSNKYYFSNYSFMFVICFNVWRWNISIFKPKIRREKRKGS